MRGGSSKEGGCQGDDAFTRVVIWRRVESGATRILVVHRSA